LFVCEDTDNNRELDKIEKDDGLTALTQEENILMKLLETF